MPSYSAPYRARHGGDNFAVAQGRLPTMLLRLLMLLHAAHHGRGGTVGAADCLSRALPPYWPAAGEPWLPSRPDRRASPY